MFCPICQEEIPEGYGFCPSCGQPVQEDPPGQRSYAREGGAPPRYRSQSGNGEAPQPRFRSQNAQEYPPQQGGYQQNYQQSYQQAYQMPYQAQRRFNPLFVVVPLVLALVIGLGFVGLSLYQNRSGEEEQENPDVSMEQEETPSNQEEMRPVPEEIPPEPVDFHALYLPILEQYQEGEDLRWVDEDFAQAGLAPMAPYYGPDAMGVAFPDLDGDGVPEMVLAGQDERILALYAMEENRGDYTPKMLISSTMNGSLSIANGNFVALETAGAFDSNAEVYEYAEGRLQSVDANSILEWYPEIFDYQPMAALLAQGNQGAQPVAPPSGGSSSGGETVFQDSYSLYSKTIYEIACALGYDTSFSDLAAQNLSELYFYNTLDSAGYAFLDINSDGVDEMIVGAIASDYDTLIAIYTIINEEVTLLFNAGEREHYALCKDGLIAYSGSSGAGNTSLLTFELTSYGLVVVNDNRTKDYTHLTDGYVPNYTSFAPILIG